MIMRLRAAAVALLCLVPPAAVAVMPDAARAAPPPSARQAAPADPLPALPPVPAPPPAPVTPAPATGSALPSAAVGARPGGTGSLPWPNSARGRARAAVAEVPAPDDPSLLGAPWPFRASGTVAEAPAIGRRGVAFVPSDAGDLTAVDSAGRKLWSTPVGPLAHTPSVTAGRDREWVSVGTGYGLIAVLDAVSGTTVWSDKLPAPVATAVVAAQRTGDLHTLFAQDAAGAVHGRDQVAPGSPPAGWSTAPGTADGPALAVTDDHVLLPSGTKHRMVYATSGTELLCLDRATGATVGTLDTRIGRITALAADGTAVYLGGDQQVAVAEPDCSAVTWTDTLTDAVTGLSPAPVDDLAVATATELVRYRNTPGGWQRLWAERLPGRAAPGSGVSVDAAGLVLVPVGPQLAAYARDPAPHGGHLAWLVRLPGPVTAPALDGAGRLYVPQDTEVHVLDDRPAFQIAYTGTGSRLRTLREVYGTADPARDAALTACCGAASPAYARDPSVLTWVAGSGPGTVTGDGAAGRPRSYPPGPVHHDPALSQRDDDGRPRLPDGREYVAFTDTTGGAAPAVKFAPLPVPGQTPLTATQFAVVQGVEPAVAATLTAGRRTAHPAFAPDGRRVAWSECGPGVNGVVVLDLRTTPRVLRTSAGDPEQGGCLDREVTFAPDSDWLAHASATGVAGWEIGGSGSFAAPVARPGLRYADASWSPDGTRIAVTVTEAGATWIGSLTGKDFATLHGPLATGANEPSYHLTELPPPRVSRVGAGTPDDVIDVYGEGFDLLRPAANQVYFTHTLRAAPLTAQVTGARVDPGSGLGVLTVRIPALAGTGPVTVLTGAGRSAAPFVVRPKPLEAVQRRSVPGARIRVFGRGFDLSPVGSTRVAFPSPTGVPVYGTVTAGTVSGDREVLTVVVPDGVVDGPLRVESNVVGHVGQGTACAVAACEFVRLHPRMEITRGDGVLAAYARQVTPGMPVTVKLTDIPVDPHFGTGRRVSLAVEPSDDPAVPAWPLRFRVPGQPQPQDSAPLRASTSDTVSDEVTAVFSRSASPAWDSWGDLDVWVNDGVHPTRPNGVTRPLARAYLQTPRLDIPVVFAAGTSGVPIDTAGPFSWVHPGEVRPYPALCVFCHVTSLPGPMTANPGTSDPRGPRVWLGPEFTDPRPGVESALALCSQMVTCSAVFAAAFATVCATTGTPCIPPLLPNPAVSPALSYPDALAFTPAGTPVNPSLRPSAADPLLRSVTLNPALAAVLGYPAEPVYEDVLAFLTGTPGAGSTLVPRDSLGRALTDVRGAVRTRPLGTGRNGIYLFPYDWRGSMPSQAAALNTFIGGVLAGPTVSSVDTNPARPGVQPIDKVAVISHSLGGPVARLAYLTRPDLTDQVISFGGAFGGVGKTVKILAMGDNWGLGKSAPLLDDLTDAGWGIAVQPWKTQQLAVNWPTAYDQSINSATWFADHGTVTPTGVVDRTLVQLWSPGGPVDVASSAALRSWLASHNPALTGAAIGYWDAPGQPGGVALEDFTGGTGPVFHYRMVGQNVPTDVGARQVAGPTLNCLPLDPVSLFLECPPRPAWWKAVKGDGDNTVPYKSAVGRSAGNDDRVFVLRAQDMPTPAGGPAPPACAQAVAAMTGNVAGSCQLKHSDLTNYGVSLALLNDILGGRVSSRSESAAAGLPFRPPFSAGAGTLENHGFTAFSMAATAPGGRSARSVTAGARPTEVEVRGAVRMTVRDQAGRTLGAPADDGFARNSIPGATYEPVTFLGAVGSGNATATLPSGGGYDVRLKADGTASAQLIVRRGDGGFSLPPTAMARGDVLTVRVPPDGPLPDSVRVTAAAGTERAVPVLALTAAGAADRSPPRTVAEVAGGAVTVRAGDEGAGIRETWLAVDGRPARYTGPVRVPSGAAVTVWSTDRAGNEEGAHGPAGAPSPMEPVVSVAPGETVPVDLAGEGAVQAEPLADWLTAEGGGDTVRLTVDRERAPAGGTTVVRLRYRGGPAAAIVVAVAPSR